MPNTIPTDLPQEQKDAIAVDKLRAGAIAALDNDTLYAVVLVKPR